MKKILLGLLAFTLSGTVAQAQEATVTGKMVRIRKNPSVEAVAVEAAPLGAKVEVLKDAEAPKGWVKVRFGKITGYMTARYIKVEGDKKAETPPETADAPRMVFSLAPSPAGGELQSAETPKTVEIRGSMTAEERIRGDISTLTETLAKEGKEPEIKSVVVIYNPKEMDAAKASLRDELKSAKQSIASLENTIDGQIGEIKRLKEALAGKEKDALDRARLEGEVNMLKVELARKSEGEGAGISELKKMISALHESVSALNAAKASAPVAKAPDNSAEMAQLRKTIETLTKMPDFKLVSLVEASGEEVYLKGVGTVRMANSKELAIFKVPKASAKSAEKVFAHLLKRVVDGGDASFFICDRDLVQQGDDGRQKG